VHPPFARLAAAAKQLDKPDASAAAISDEKVWIT
jgi:hypothetical protein